MAMPNNYFKMKYLNFLTVFLFVCLVVSCKKDEKPTTTPTTTTTTNSSTGKIVVTFQAKADTASLVFGKKYVNYNLDTFTVSKFSYFISNVVLFNKDNTPFYEKESYHAVKHLNGSNYSFTISNVPADSYKSIRFMIGVDSIRNVSGVQSGDLDPANSSDLYWSWSTGYIFMKLEGIAPKSAASNKKYEYHIGGFGGINKTQRNFDLSFNNLSADVKENVAPIIYLKSNVNQVFSNPTAIDFRTQYNILNAGANAKMIADNYADMITFDRLQNN